MAALLAVPMIPSACISAAVTSVRYRVNPFYTSARLDENLEPFEVRKLRGLTEPDENGVQVPLGRLSAFLRKVGLDEGFQFFNILRGELHLIGPRAISPEDLNVLRENVGSRFFQIGNLVISGQDLLDQFLNAYRECGPALIGMTQIGPYRKSFSEGDLPDIVRRMLSDCYYCKTASLSTDVLILVSTLGAVFNRLFRMAGIEPDDIKYIVGAEQSRPADYE